MKIKTNELTGAALDWAVAKCKGWIKGDITHPKFCRLWRDQIRTPATYPSTDWAQGGPIIERERLQLITELGGEMWVCSSPKAVEIGGYRKYCFASGPTPLIAAMRCYCSFKLGDEVDVPDELLK